MPLNPFSKPIKFRISVNNHNISSLKDLKMDYPAFEIESGKITILQLERLLAQHGEKNKAAKLASFTNIPVLNNDHISEVVKIVFEDELLGVPTNNPLSLSLTIYPKYPKSGINLLTYFLTKRPELVDDLIDKHQKEIHGNDLSVLFENTNNPRLKNYSNSKDNGDSVKSVDLDDPFTERDRLEGKDVENNSNTSISLKQYVSCQLQNSVNELRKLIDINTPIISICDHDFVRVDKIIKEAVGDNLDRVIEWSAGVGSSDFRNKKASMINFSYLNKDDDNPSTPNKVGLIDLLEACLNVHKDYIYVLKDIHLCLNEQMQSTEGYQTVTSLLHTIAQNKLYNGATKQNRHGFNATIIVVNSNPFMFPKELTPYVSYLDIPRPDDYEIEMLIQHHLEINNAVISGDKKKIILSLKGLTSFEIDRALDMAISENGNLTDKDTKLITAQKKNMIKNSGLLELIETDGNINEIGGLDFLKVYLKKKGKLMTNYKDALDFGLSMPKGIMLVGMPGCGKSMCAKAASCLFDNIPLLKMDIGNLQGQYVGQSEANMREAIKMAEAAAPCILWIDEIEKAFAGIGSGSEAYTTRMFGTFLSWMQDKNSQVYIIATANNIENLPAEFKRKGRFDEIFCMDLPNRDECLKIFDAQLANKKRNCPKLSDLPQKNAILDKVTNHYNGADINAIIDIALESLYLNGDDKNNKNKLSEALKKASDSTVGIYDTCTQQIDNMRKEFEKNSFVNATTGIITPKKK